jgi:Arc/MetJ-type ribon-helix-helix transcriptional regulator
MSDAELTSLTLRLPQYLRDRIKQQAAAEERTESQFVRFHLSNLLGDPDADSRIARRRKSANA